MKKSLVLIILLVISPLLQAATDPRGNVISQYPLGFQNIQPAASTAMTIPAGTRHAMLSVRGAGVMMRDDGVAPTATVGFYFPAGTIVKIDNDPKWLASMRFICSDDAGTCRVFVNYYRDRRPSE